MTGLPKMLSDVLAAYLDSQDDIEVVATESNSEPAELVRTCHADVVVVGGGPGLPHAAGALFERIPQVAVLAISANGRDASRFRLVGEQITLLDTSPQEIVDTIRETNDHNLLGMWQSNG